MSSGLTSLDLLGATWFVPEKRRALTPTETHVRDLTLRYIAILDHRDLSDSIFDHISPEIVFTHEAGGQSVPMESRAQLIDWIPAVLGPIPQYRSETLDVQVLVDADGDSAKSWIVKTAAGYKDGLSREIVLQLSWERQKGGWWVCYNHHGLRSIPLYDSWTIYRPWTLAAPS